MSEAQLNQAVVQALVISLGPRRLAGPLGIGEGGEQNAPLGRAVIGGLLFATVATLFFVPSVFVIIHGRRQARMAAKNQ